MARELQDINSSGELTDIKLTSTQDANRLLQKQEIEAELANKEDSLGNPDESGKALVSTDSGVRSWEAKVEEAPSDGNEYVRKDEGWEINSGGVGVPEAPDDGFQYGRQSKTWTKVAPAGAVYWGDLTGTLSNQTDLQAELDAKVSKAGDSMTGELEMGDNKITGLKNGVQITDAATVGQVSTMIDNIDKGDIGLENVDNTSDANKPISIATQSALNGKEQSLGNPTVNGQVLSSTTTGTRSWITPSGGGTGGQVDSVVAGANMTVDATDPVNPIVIADDMRYDDTAIQAEVDLNTAKVSYTDAALVAQHTTDIGTNEADILDLYANKPDISSEDTLTGTMKLAVVTALPGTPDADTIYFVTT